MTDLPILTSCEGCGACCRHLIAPPFVLAGGRNEAAEKGVPATLMEELLPLWQVRLLIEARPCCWYDDTTARCRHYELRPDACRAFEINSPSCHASREMWGVTPEPGQFETDSADGIATGLLGDTQFGSR